VTLPVAAAAANAREDQRDYEREVAQTRAALVSAADADSLAAAALLGGVVKGRGAASLQLMARASAQAPDRPDLTWLHAQLCAREASCNSDPVMTHLRALDPTNGLAWTEPVGQVAPSNDPEQSRARLAALANAGRFDIYWNSIVAHTTTAILKTGTMDASSALVSALGLAAAWAIPAYQGLTRLCKGDALRDPKVRADCRRLSDVLRRGDTYISEMVGIAIAEKASAEGDPEYQGALSARRTIHYRMALTSKLDIEGAEDGRFATRYLQLLASHRTEQEVALAQLIIAGIPPNPPDDWKDPHPD
jgi:hypothetical protein